MGKGFILDYRCPFPIGLAVVIIEGFFQTSPSTAQLTDDADGRPCVPVTGPKLFLHIFTKTHMLHGAGIFANICPNKITQLCRYIYQHHGACGIYLPCIYHIFTIYLPYINHILTIFLFIFLCCGRLIWDNHMGNIYIYIFGDIWDALLRLDHWAKDRWPSKTTLDGIRLWPCTAVHFSAQVAGSGWKLATHVAGLGMEGPQLLAGWWFGCHFWHFPIYWECHHPNWLSYFSEGWLNHQPVGDLLKTSPKQPYLLEMKYPFTSFGWCETLGRLTRLCPSGGFQLVMGVPR